MTHWMAYGAAAGGVRALLFDGAVLQQQRLFTAEREVLNDWASKTAHQVQIEGTAPDTAPVRVSPEGFAYVPAVTQASPPDALSGWTRLRIAGVLSQNANWDCVIVDVAGPVTHLVHVSADEIVSFQGMMTGRLTSALGWAHTADPAAVEASLSRPERLAAQLHIAVLTSQTEAITGHLIGAEIAAAKPYWLGQEVILLSGPGPLHAPLAGQGAMVVTADPEAMLCAGLAAFAIQAGFAD